MGYIVSLGNWQVLILFQCSITVNGVLSIDFSDLIFLECPAGFLFLTIRWLVHHSIGRILYSLTISQGLKLTSIRKVLMLLFAVGNIKSSDNGFFKMQLKSSL